MCIRDRKVATRDSYGNALVELGKEHDDLIVFVSNGLKESINATGTIGHFRCV